ncbi:MAG: hypothetical protein HKO01_00260 [Flaviramulus sp.]|nr:hypothetical protein [Flaviramulus sp.]NNC48951.1 hypothetical protein [Flaviramulus sp.]
MKKKTEDLSDREIQEGIYRNLREIRHNTRTTKTLIYLFGILVLASFIMSLWPLVSLFKNN